MAHHISLMYQQHTVPMFEFDCEPADKVRFGLSAGRPVDPSRIPTRAHQTDHEKIHDIFSMPGLNAVGERFRQIVESFDPGVHQFFPLALHHKNGEPVDGEFYIFNCTVSFDALLMEYSDVEWHRKRTSGKRFVWADPHGKWVLSRLAIGGRHVWCGDKIGSRGGVFVSDELHSALKRDKIQFFEDKYCEEIDEPWRLIENLESEQ